MQPENLSGLDLALCISQTFQHYAGYVSLQGQSVNVGYVRAVLLQDTGTYYPVHIFGISYLLLLLLMQMFLHQYARYVYQLRVLLTNAVIFQGCLEFYEIWDIG